MSSDWALKCIATTRLADSYKYVKHLDTDRLSGDTWLNIEDLTLS